jgi:hypothetical protein
MSNVMFSHTIPLIGVENQNWIASWTHIKMQFDWFVQA